MYTQTRLTVTFRPSWSCSWSSPSSSSSSSSLRYKTFWTAAGVGRNSSRSQSSASPCGKNALSSSLQILSTYYLWVISGHLKPHLLHPGCSLVGTWCRSPWCLLWNSEDQKHHQRHFHERSSHHLQHKNPQTWDSSGNSSFKNLLGFGDQWRQ